MGQIQDKFGSKSKKAGGPTLNKAPTSVTQSHAFGYKAASSPIRNSTTQASKYSVGLSSTKVYSPVKQS